MDFYQVLKLEQNATQDDIKIAYRKLALLHHPDKAGNTADNTSQFVKVREAYDTLSDPHRREQYDIDIDKRAKHVDHRNQKPVYEDRQPGETSQCRKEKRDVRRSERVSEEKGEPKKNYVWHYPIPSKYTTSPLKPQHQQAPHGEEWPQKRKKASRNREHIAEKSDSTSTSKHRPTRTIHIVVPPEMFDLYKYESERLLEVSKALRYTLFELQKLERDHKPCTKRHESKITELGCSCWRLKLIKDLASLRSEAELWRIHHKTILENLGDRVPVNVPTGSRSVADVIGDAERSTKRIQAKLKAWKDEKYAAVYLKLQAKHGPKPEVTPKLQPITSAASWTQLPSNQIRIRITSPVEHKVSISVDRGPAERKTTSTKYFVRTKR